MTETADPPLWEGGRLSTPTGPIHVLVVGGELEDADRVRGQLQALGWGTFDVMHARSLDEAASALRKWRFDAALLFQAPVDGVDAIRRLHAEAPEVPDIVIGHSDDEASESAAIERGALEYVGRRHLSGAVLGRIVRTAIERGRLVRQIQALVMRNSDAVLVVDRDGIVKFANPAAERMFRRPRAELIGEMFGFPIETRSRAEVAIVSGHDPRYAEMKVADIDWDGRPAFLATLRDITDRKRAEDLQTRLLHADRLASVGQLAAGVAHEVNNPAAFVMANLSFMDDELGVVEALVQALRPRAAEMRDGDELLVAIHKADEAMREMREQLRENLYGMDRIVKIMRDLRAFSRIEREEVELVDVNDIIRVACSMTANEIRHRARLVQDLRVVPLVPADRGKLAQVMTNLLVNAAQAIGDGAVDRNTISVRSFQDGDEVRVTVEDTGPGIPEAVQRRIFEPFFTTKPRDQGTGLGLSLSLEIVRKHGGELRFASHPGVGTTFEVRLPVDGPMGALLQKGPATTVAQRPARRARILVIDDEHIILTSFRRMLSKEHDVITAAGGQEALSLLEADQAFDVVLCDLMMPDLDGVALHARITERWPALAERVIFCSGGAFTPRAKEFVSAVRNITLEKPVSWELLRAVVDRVAAGAPQQS